MSVLYSMLYGLSIAAIDTLPPFVLLFQLFEGRNPLDRPQCIWLWVAVPYKGAILKRGK